MDMEDLGEEASMILEEIHLTVLEELLLLHLVMEVQQCPPVQLSMKKSAALSMNNSVVQLMNNSAAQ